MTIRESASRRLRSQSIRPDAVADNIKRSRSNAVNLMTSIQLMHEAMSRARTRRPQEVGTSEAYRPAKQIAMNSHRHEQSRLLGL
jgi:methylthioribose-1-phosphate isomerase